MVISIYLVYTSYYTRVYDAGLVQWNLLRQVFSPFYCVSKFLEVSM